MATVISLTEAKIKELLAGWEGVSLSQDEINALVLQLQTSQETVTAEMETIQNTTIPQMQGDLSATVIQVGDLSDTVIPNLETGLNNTSAQVDNINLVTIPALQTDLANEIENSRLTPQTYVQPEEPTNPDENDRDLLVGDTWLDDNDNNKERRWNGVEWSPVVADVADFSLTVRKFLTTTHMLY